MTSKIHNIPEGERGPTAAVIGGGLAGMTAAWRLAQKGYRVTLFERGRHLGGRAASCEIHLPGRDSQNKKNGEESEIERDSFFIDNGQHLFLDACSSLARLHDEWGIADSFDRVAPIRFVFERGADWRFGAAPGLPGLLRFLPSLAAMKFLSIRERFATARMIGRLIRLTDAARENNGGNFGDFLTRFSTSDRARELFWNPILLSALCDFPENVSLRAAAKVIREGIIAGKGPVLSVPNRPLRTIYHNRVLPVLTRIGVDLRLAAAVDRFYFEKNGDSPPRIAGIVLRREEQPLSFDRFVLAVDYRSAETILRRSELDSWADALDFRHFSGGAVTAIHLWLDRRLIPEPAVVLSGGIGQWLFCPRQQNDWNRRDGQEEGVGQGDVSGNGGRKRHGAEPIYHQVLISGSHRLSLTFPPDASKWTRLAVDQLRRLFPEMNSATLYKTSVTTVPNAVLLPSPSPFAVRPAAVTPFANLFLAGDWLDTGWPSTLEGAVRGAAAAVKNC